ncbi:valine--tRNA ligase, mitochondrial isoform X2 [Haliaeetus albicilla]|uniref:valine--tRNA ligase, mitochondrial isoform X2 n=1 Tax=Haliaeetus albicilla TaxID=8969 RepID=UPI0037E9C021
MAAPALARVLTAAPRALGSPVGGRARCSGVPPGSPLPPAAPPWDAPERARLRAREHKEKRQRQRRERAALGGAGPQVQTAPPKGWTPKTVVEYQHPLDPDGKKATGVALPPAYSPRYVEAAWYSWWERQGLFTPPASPSPALSGAWSWLTPAPSCVRSQPMFPLSATPGIGGGPSPQLGAAPPKCHRFPAPGPRAHRRPPGRSCALAVVERWLWQQRGLRRQDLTRSEFLEEVWAWKQRHGDEILRQLRALGASLDWSRCAFTMDPGFSRAVVEAFVRLHKAGLIHRDRRLVTWSCALRSALADVEVEPRALTGPTALRIPGCPQPVTFGVLVTFAYPVEGGDGLELPVATTRPETMLGDVAVAVHPDDPRYRYLHGRHLRHPFTGQLLPVVTDPTVEPARGTGAVKVTPGHSSPDLALARAHGLPLVSVIGDDGTMCPPGGGWLQGIHRFVAREKVVAALAERGLYRGTQDHAMTLPMCSRSGDVIEYLLKSQWFLRCREMAERAREAVTSGRLQLVPKFHEKNWKMWMDNIGDWCLSRQLWWGHRVPAYRVGVPLAGSPPEHPDGLWVVGRSEAEARASAARTLRCPPEELQLQQDPDVLDTWFSSALFPFAALGWPEETPDLQRFYPTNLLETGSDLLFFWVARMVMLGQQLTGCLPFSQVLLHSLVRDTHGRKMSKSLGNVIDPCDIIAGASLQELQERLHHRLLDPHELTVATEGQRRQFPHGIPECGTDALRMALCSHNVHGDDIRLDVGTALSYRHFCNKIWNAVKFVLAALGPNFVPQPPEEMVPQHPMDQWVLSRLVQAVAECGRRMEALEVHGAIAAVHHFWLRSFCDVYLETAKPTLRDPATAAETRRTLLSCAELGLRLLAPFAPFLSEELWQRLPRAPPAPPTLCLAPFPDAARLAHWCCPRVEAQVAAMQEVVRTARALRDVFCLGAARPPVAVRCVAEAQDSLAALGPALQALAQVGPLQLLPQGAEPELGPGWVGAPAGPDTHVYLCLRGLVEPAATQAQLRARSRGLQRRLETLGGTQGATESPPHPGTQQQVAILRSKLARLAQALEALDPPSPPKDPGVRRGDPGSQ